MFKKTLTIIAAAALVLTMVGCSNKASTEETGTGPNSTQTTSPESDSTKPKA